MALPGAAARAGAVLAVSSLWTAACVPAAAAVGAAVELRLLSHSALDAGNLHLAADTATTLLASAGIVVSWRDCGRETCTGAEDAGIVLVHLRPYTKARNRSASGEVVHDSATLAPTVLVYLPTFEELLGAIETGTATRTHPALRSTRIGHLVGMTIAHEVGHALGLPHAATGVMKARLSVREVVALRASRLRFTREQAAAMHQALRLRMAEAPKRARPPL
jgi:hypothetical protein